MTNWDRNNSETAQQSLALQTLMDTFIKAKAQQESLCKPLKAVRISRASLLLFPVGPSQDITAVHRLCGVPIQLDETLAEGEWAPVYA